MQERFDYPIRIPDGEPPVEFKIWDWGENKTLRGSVVLDEESASEMMAAYKDHGIDLVIDYEHQTFNSEENGQSAPAAGWYKPEVRQDGIWATAVQWTERAREYLKSREYRYFSPSALLDVKTRRPTQLLPMALTNWPATKQIEPLVAKNEINGEREMKSVLSALGLKADVEEVEAFSAVSKLRDFEKSVLMITNANSTADAVGVLTALKLKAEKADDYAQELAKLKSSTVEKEKAALIDQAILNGIAPAKRAELETLELGSLKLCLSLLPTVKAPAIELKEDNIERASDHGLTKSQLKILKATGVSPEKWAARKQQTLDQIAANSEEK